MNRLLAFPLIAATFFAIPHARAEESAVVATAAVPTEAAVSLATVESTQQHGSIVVMRGTDANGNAAMVAFNAPEKPAPAADGRPIYDGVPSLPKASASTWGSYRPVIRKSQQIEHLAGIINAGYLR